MVAEWLTNPLKQYVCHSDYGSERCWEAKSSFSALLFCDREQLGDWKKPASLYLYLSASFCTILRWFLLRFCRAGFVVVLQLHFQSSISQAAPGVFHQVRLSRQTVKILHLFIGEFSQDRNGRKTAHKGVLWHASGTACGRPGMLQWAQNWLPPSAASAAALCWEGTMCSKALLAFTGHVPLSADFSYAVNWFVAQLTMCAST